MAGTNNTIKELIHLINGSEISLNICKPIGAVICWVQNQPIVNPEHIFLVHQPGRNYKEESLREHHKTNNEENLINKLIGQF